MAPSTRIISKSISNGDKVEFLKFQGDDVRGWAFRCEQFFSIDNTPNEDKVKIVSVHLSDKALLWHRQYLSVNGENVGWEVYKNAIIQIFGSIFEDPMFALKNAKYAKNAREYQDLFDTLLCRVTISQEHAISLNLGGLPTELEMSVRMFKPATLADAYSLTMLQEVILDAMKKKNKTSGSFNANRFANGEDYGNVNKPSILPNLNTPVNLAVRKQLSQKEYQEKRAQNLLPDEEDYFEDCLDNEEENRTSMGIEELQPQISLKALTRTNNFQTMKVIGTVEKHLVHILVDCGSIHNFLDKNMAKKLGCLIRPTGPLAVTIAYGYNLVATSECKDFKWQFDNTNFTTNVMLLPLGVVKWCWEFSG
ncbi:RNA-directed DNA polymerase like protein [Tanacetum coccineum]